MSPTGARDQPVVRQLDGAAAKAFDQLDAGFRVRRTRHHLHLHEGRAERLLEPAAAGERQREPGAPGRDRLVDLVHLVVAQQRVVRVARCRLHDEHQHAGGFAVEPVHRRQGADAELAHQPHQRRFLQVAAAGRCRQEVRFVHHHEVIVVVQQLEFKGDAWFGRRAAPVPQQRARHAGLGPGERLAARGQHLAARQARRPVGCVGHARRQEFGERGPWAGADGDAAGVHAVARRRRPRRRGARHGGSSRRSARCRRQASSGWLASNTCSAVWPVSCRRLSSAMRLSNTKHSPTHSRSASSMC